MVGNGENTEFWEDNWKDTETLYTVSCTSSLEDICLKDMTKFL